MKRLGINLQPGDWATTHFSGKQRVVQIIDRKEDPLCESGILLRANINGDDDWYDTYWFMPHREGDAQ